MRTPSSFAVAAALLLLSSCCGEGTGHRQDINDGQEPSRYKENPDWTITYTGRSVQTENGVYIVDDLHVASTSQTSYYLDVVSSGDYESVYSSDIAKLIEGSYENLDTQYVTSGDSDASYDRLSDEEWVAVAYEILSDGSLGDKYAMLKFTPADFEMTKDDTYSISVNGRQTDSQGEIYDEISVATDSPVSYYVEVASAGYIDFYFGGDETTFFNYVLDNLASDLSDDEDFSGLVSIGNSKVEYNRLRSGEWTAYAFGVDYNGYLTGNWSSYTFSLEEEEPSEAFQKWLGEWTIGDGNTSYDIAITSSEANYYYLVSGWETGADASDFANQNAAGYQFETAFYGGKDMDFQTYYITTDTDDQIGEYQAWLAGNIDINDSNGLPYCIVEEGIPIATAQLGVDENTATVTALDVNANIGGATQAATFVSMQFIDMTTHGMVIYIYNGGDGEKPVPQFPMTMTRKSDGGSSAKAETSSPRKLIGTRRSGGAAATKSADLGIQLRRQPLSGASGKVRTGNVRTKAAEEGDAVRTNSMRTR